MLAPGFTTTKGVFDGLVALIWLVLKGFTGSPAGQGDPCSGRLTDRTRLRLFLVAALYLMKE